MTSTSDIMASIQSIVSSIGVSYAAWRIGITHDPIKRQSEWSADGHNTGSWRQWLSTSLTDAESIEAAFIRAGMQGGTGGGCTPFRPVYVYIF
jgi:hypothetical protein